MSFNEQDLYNIAENLIRETGFEVGFEARVIELLRATQNRDTDSVQSSLSGLDEEAREDAAEAVALAIRKAHSAIEEDVIVNGTAEEIEYFNDLREAQLKMIESLGE